MDIHDFAFIKGLKFRTYFLKVSCVVLMILNSYKIIADDKVNLFYLLAFTLTSMSSVEMDRTLSNVEHLKSKHEETYDHRNTDGENNIPDNPVP